MEALLGAIAAEMQSALGSPGVVFVVAGNVSPRGRSANGLPIPLLVGQRSATLRASSCSATFRSMTAKISSSEMVQYTSAITS
jgi:hypothetical protein